MRSKEKLDADHRIATILSKQYAHQSRRSFLYRLTKAGFAVLGVSLAGEMPLFLVPKARADWTTPTPRPWNYCGLDGAECGGSGACASINPGDLSGGESWIQCCQNTQTDPCQLYYCCTYTDVCQADTFDNSDCQGLGTGSSDMWCGGNQDTPYVYVCTKISCANSGFKTEDGCTNNGCQGHMHKEDGGPYVCPDKGGP